MRIKAKRNFTMPGIGGFASGEEYDVTEQVGQTMLTRELAEKAKAPKKEEPAKGDGQSSKKQSNKEKTKK